MFKALLSFLQKTYKIFAVIILAVGFFVFYNHYLVDRSLLDLRAALDRLDQVHTTEDLQKLKPFLKVLILKEISQPTFSSLAIASLESSLHLADTAEIPEQIEDIKFFLSSLIEEKQKGRAGVLLFLDRLNKFIYQPETQLPRDRLETEARSLSSRIGSLIHRPGNELLLQNLYFDLGNTYLQLGDIFKTEEIFLKVIEIDSTTPLALKSKFNLAWMYKSIGQYEKAIVYFEELSKQGITEELPIFSNYQLADVFLKKGEYKAASDAFAHFSDEYPKFSVADLALFEAAYICFYNLDDRECALVYLARLEEKFPHSKLIQHEMKKMRPVMAGNFLAKGYRQTREKKYFEAVETFRSAAQIAPFDGRVFIGMALDYYWLNMRPEALELTRKAISYSPDSEVVLINSLFIYINLELFDEAIKLGEQAISAKRQRRPEFHYNLGYAYLKKAQATKAKMHFARTIEHNPKFIFAYNNLGCSLWHNRDYSEALKRFKEAVARDPNYADAHYNLGVAYFYINQLIDAYKEFKLTLAIDPDYKEAERFIKRIVKILKYEP